MALGIVLSLVSFAVFVLSLCHVSGVSDDSADEAFARWSRIPEAERARYCDEY